MSGVQDAAIQAAETIQSAHIIHSPSVEHDINPSTAASEKEPIRIDRSPSEDVVSELDEDEVPISVLRPAPRKPQMPPLPDLRFEQSYLASIQNAKDWKVVTYITVRDQVCRMDILYNVEGDANGEPGIHAACAGHGMDFDCFRLETFEPLFSVQGTDSRCED